MSIEKQLELPLFRSLDEQTLSSLACMQLSRLIRNGKHVEQCKAEWKQRWGMEWPMYRTVNGIQSERSV